MGQSKADTIEVSQQFATGHPLRSSVMVYETEYGQPRVTLAVSSKHIGGGVGYVTLDPEDAENIADALLSHAHNCKRLRKMELGGD